MATNLEALPVQENPSVPDLPIHKNPSIPSVPLTPPPVPDPSGSMAAENIFKSKLQEYTQKASQPFPVYQTVKEGPPHGFVFRSTVWVDGVPYVSSTAFLQRKSAEQDAARVALSALPPLPEVVNQSNHAESYELRPFINESPHNSSRGYNGGNHSSGFSNQNKGAFMARDSTGYRPSERGWNSSNQRQEGYSDASTAMIRGPREKCEGNLSKTSSRPGDGWQGQKLKRDKYNLEDFPCKYKTAKFYVLKSFSEDDVHKSIKYKVWSSTPKGNEKLDQAFHDAEANAKRTGTKHPIFLFFSVNASGLFLGVAEMTGQVDFNKNLDFWQADRWVGFFPVKWHIIKDVPSRMFYDIILENNDHMNVTRSRDTQEVELKQGVEMLQIFKNYSEKTSLLDDFYFYDNRQRSLKANRRRKSFSHNSGSGRMENQCEEADYMTSSSLVKLTKNLAL